MNQLLISGMKYPKRLLVFLLLTACTTKEMKVYLDEGYKKFLTPELINADKQKECTKVIIQDGQATLNLCTTYALDSEGRVFPVEVITSTENVVGSNLQLTVNPVISSAYGTPVFEMQLMKNEKADKSIRFSVKFEKGKGYSVLQGGEYIKLE